MIRRIRCIAAALLASSLHTVVFAAPEPGDLQGFQWNWENDLWARGRTDRWYTNGMRYTWTYALSDAQSETTPTSASPAPISSRIRKFGDDVAALGPYPGRQSSTVGYAIGQNLYTPRHIGDPDPQPMDRPYGAFLYFSTTLSAFGEDDGSFRATDLKLGVAGPAALGDETQSLVHRAINNDVPQGWKYQVKARPGIELSHLRLYRLGAQTLPDWLGTQVGWGAVVGSLRTYASLQGTIFIGAVNNNSAPLSIANEGDFVVQDYRNVNTYRHPLLFVSTTITGVAYNYFITGATPYGRSEISHMPWVGALQWGFSIPLPRFLGYATRMAYAQTARTAEFKSPGLDRREAVQRWGMLSLNVDLD
jgi:lipid A 3-O-deacylase